MSIFGLMTQKEVQRQVEDAVKAAMTERMPKWALATADAEQFQMPDLSVYENQADLYRKLSAVAQAVDITSSAGAVTRFSVMRKINDKEPKDIPNHDFEVLLDKPNPLDSRFEFLKATIASWILNGNAYWWLNRPSPDVPPVEMWFIPAHMIIPVPDDQMYLRGYYYYPGTGAEMILEPHEIVQFKRFNPFSRFIGLSAVEAIAMTAMGLLGMQQWNTKLFAENNARLPGILAFKQMIEDSTWEKIKAETRDASRKRELMMLRGVGDGVDWQQNAISQKDMEFLGGLSAGSKEIMDTLAPGLFTWLSGESTYSNANANRAAFNELTLFPLHTMMSEGITRGILGAYPGRPLMGCFEDVRISDKSLELQEMAEYAKTHTVAEVREKYYGDSPLGDDRDKLLVAQINAQSGGIQEPPPSPFGKDPAKEEDEEGKEKEPRMMEEREMEKDKEEQKPEDDEAAKMAREELGRYQRKALKAVGKPVEFVSDILPAGTLDSIHAQLGKCTSETAVKAVFDAARDGLKPKRKESAETVLEGIREAIRLLPFTIKQGEV